MTTFLSTNSYVLPTGFNIFDIECWGTNGESKFGYNGGIGGYIKGRFAGIAQNLQINIGGTGDDGSYYHGGSANPGSGGGAGAGVRLQMAANALIVAGGGGGSRSAPNLADAGAGGDTEGQAGVIPNSGGKQNVGGTGQDTWNNGSYRFGGLSGFSDGTGGAGGGGGGGFYGGGASGSFNSIPSGPAGGGGGGSNGYELQSGIILLGPITTLRGGSPLIPSNPGGTLGAVCITPIGWYSTYTGDIDTYTVPEGVQCLQVQLWGGNGGASSLRAGSQGGYCEAQIQVATGDSLDLAVGGAGGIGIAGTSAGGILNGGAGVTGPLATGGGGGAGSGILFGSSLIIAAGGGGGSSASSATSHFGGDGGRQTGFDGIGTPVSGQGGQIGVGGAGGIGDYASGSPGSGSIGGDGANPGDASGSGGGGGGYTGGGGGGMNDLFGVPNIGSGGGGSSNYDPASPLPISLFATIPAITLPTNPDVSGNGVIVITPGACVCVAQGTCVETMDGEIEIQNLNPGVFVKDCNGNIDIVRMVVQNKVIPRQFLQCQTGCFGMGTPNKELLITKEHPLLVEGREVTGDILLDSQLSGVRMVNNSNVLPVFTLITDRRTFVKMNGVFVATWSEAAWLNFVANDCAGRFV